MASHSLMARKDVMLSLFMRVSFGCHSLGLDEVLAGFAECLMCCLSWPQLQPRGTGEKLLLTGGGLVSPWLLLFWGWEIHSCLVLYFSEQEEEAKLPSQIISVMEKLSQIFLYGQSTSISTGSYSNSAFLKGWRIGVFGTCVLIPQQR